MFAAGFLTHRRKVAKKRLSVPESLLCGFAPLRENHLTVGVPQSTLCCEVS
jgi:hypothetical protein